MTWQTYKTTLTNKAWKKFGTVSSISKQRLAAETRKVLSHLREKGLLVKATPDGNTLVIIWAKLPTLSKYEGKAKVVHKLRDGTINRFTTSVSALAKTSTEARKKVKEHLGDTWYGIDMRKTTFTLKKTGHGASRAFNYRSG